MGSYVFLWGQKQERTPTWYGVFLEDGAETEAVDVMHYIWNGEWPANRSPAVEGMVLDARSANESMVLAPGAEYEASILAADPDGDTLSYRWEIMEEVKRPRRRRLEQCRADCRPSDAVVTANGSPRRRTGAYRLSPTSRRPRQAGHATFLFTLNDDELDGIVDRRFSARPGTSPWPNRRSPLGWVRGLAVIGIVSGVVAGSAVPAHRSPRHPVNGMPPSTRPG